MNTQQFKELRSWFTSYVKQYLVGEGGVREIEVRDAMVLKTQHTGRVCAEILALGSDLALPPHELVIAKVIALLHDVGRFEQFKRYGTFADRHSVNHAEMGVTIIKGQRVLDSLSPNEQDLILDSVRFHNRAQLPQNASATCLFFTKLLRDADKLDIWRVVTAYYASQTGKRNGAIELDLPDTPGYTRAVGEDLMAGRIVDVNQMRNCNDFKLAQAGWVYDVNFGPTFQRVHERNYLGKIRRALPRDDGIDAMFETITAYLERQRMDRQDKGKRKTPPRGE